MDGVEHELDCLIFATGFEVGTSYTRRAGYDVTGRDGEKLSDKWSNGLKTLHGFTTHGFPNCFFLGFTQAAVTVNVPHALNAQAVHITHIMNEACARRATTIEATAAGEQGWLDEIERTAKFGQRFRAECTPGYYNNEGKGGGSTGFLSGQYGDGPVAFFKLMDDWRDEGKFEGLEMTASKK